MCVPRESNSNIITIEGLSLSLAFEEVSFKLHSLQTTCDPIFTAYTHSYSFIPDLRFQPSLRRLTVTHLSHIYVSNLHCVHSQLLIYPTFTFPIFTAYTHSYSFIPHLRFQSSLRTLTATHLSHIYVSNLHCVHSQLLIYPTFTIFTAYTYRYSFIPHLRFQSSLRTLTATHLSHIYVSNLHCVHSQLLIYPTFTFPIFTAYTHSYSFIPHLRFQSSLRTLTATYLSHIYVSNLHCVHSQLLIYPTFTISIFTAYTHSYSFIPHSRFQSSLRILTATHLSHIYVSNLHCVLSQLLIYPTFTFPIFTAYTHSYSFIPHLQSSLRTLTDTHLSHICVSNLHCVHSQLLIYPTFTFPIFTAYTHRYSFIPHLRFQSSLRTLTATHLSHIYVSNLHCVHSQLLIYPTFMFPIFTAYTHSYSFIPHLRFQSSLRTLTATHLSHIHVSNLHCVYSQLLIYPTFTFPIFTAYTHSYLFIPHLRFQSSLRTLTATHLSHIYVSNLHCVHSQLLIYPTFMFPIFTAYTHSYSFIPHLRFQSSLRTLTATHLSHINVSNLHCVHSQLIIYPTFTFTIFTAYTHRYSFIPDLRFQSSLRTLTATHLSHIYVSNLHCVHSQILIYPTFTFPIFTAYTHRYSFIPHLRFQSSLRTLTATHLSHIYVSNLHCVHSQLLIYPTFMFPIFTAYTHSYSFIPHLRFQSSLRTLTATHLSHIHVSNLHCVYSQLLIYPTFTFPIFTAYTHSYLFIPHLRFQSSLRTLTATHLSHIYVSNLHCVHSQLLIYPTFTFPIFTAYTHSYSFIPHLRFQSSLLTATHLFHIYVSNLHCVHSQLIIYPTFTFTIFTAYTHKYSFIPDLRFQSSLRTLTATHLSHIYVSNLHCVHSQILIYPTFTFPIFTAYTHRYSFIPHLRFQSSLRTLTATHLSHIYVSNLHCVHSQLLIYHIYVSNLHFVLSQLLIYPTFTFPIFTAYTHSYSFIPHLRFQSSLRTLTANHLSHIYVSNLHCVHSQLLIYP